MIPPQAGDDDRPDYLFNPAAPPDPEVAALERRLAPFRQRDAGPEEWAAQLAAARRRTTARRWWIAGAVAAAALVVLSTRIDWSTNPGPLPTPAVSTAIALDFFEGDVRLTGGERLAARAAGDEPLTLDAGESILCAAGASARLRVGEIGWLDVEEESRVSVVAGDAGGECEGAFRLDLEQGSVRASIFAAPRVFSLGTPSGLAVDLGCVYRATVDADGHTHLAVVSGRVSFESDGRKVYVPARASCSAWPGHGPGTPVWDTAAEPFRSAVARHDRARAEGAVCATTAATARLAIEEILTTDDKRDSLTLWHLLDVPEPDLRADLFERLRELAPPPAGVTREQCLAADAEALAAWRAEIDARWW